MRGRFTFLLAALVAFLLSSPLVRGEGRSGIAVSALFAGVLVVAVYAVSRRRGSATVAAVLAAAALALRVAHLLDGDPRVGMASWATAAVFLLLTALLVLRRVVARGRVDGDRISGAVCVYLLLGLAWAFVYNWVNSGLPGSFDVPAGVEHEAVFTYYSFSTLTTLGYGDVVPRTPFARTLAWMEAVAGQMFLAVTVATLVGLRISAGAGTTPGGGGGDGD
jgi:hypothetical protein